MSEEQQKKKNAARRRRRGCIYPLLGITVLLCGLLYVTAPSPEEMEATEAAETAQVLNAEQTAVAQSTLQTWTPSPTHTATNTPTVTPTITNTPIPSATPTITDTPLPSATPRPEEVAAEIVNGIVGTPDTLIVNERVITVRWPMGSFMAGTQARTDPKELACEFIEAGLTDGRTYQLTGTIQMVSRATGQESTAEGVEAILPPAVYDDWNCDNLSVIDLSLAVRGVDGARFDLHPELQ